MKTLFATARLIAGVAGLTAVVATFLDTASRTTINPFNFFGFFTTQSNILTAVTLIMLAVVGFARRTPSPALRLLHASVTTYIVIVGVVYNTLLVGLEGGITLGWANVVLHVIIPIYAAVDWVLFGDRSALPWRSIWVVLIYPLVWLVVIIIRGATDGWVPYPFLNPSLGYGVVALYAVGIAVAIGAVGLGVWALSRVRILKP
jgi:hypothetical protein